MANSDLFDQKVAHEFFAVDCFNRAWDLIDKTQRTRDEDLLMVELNQASIFHWKNRSDCSDKNLSIGYWQASRIQAILGNAKEASRYAEVCLDFSKKLEPFYLGYAYEAMARAAALGNNQTEALRLLNLAKNQAELVDNADNRDLLLGDLNGISL